MDELTESARQCLVSQGIILGGFSIIISIGLSIVGILVTTKNDDILHFIALYQLAILEIGDLFLHFTLFPSCPGTHILVTPFRVDRSLRKSRQSRTSLVFSRLFCCLAIACGLSSLMIVLYVWWIIAGYRNRQIVVRSKYLDEKMSKGLVALILPILLTFAAFIVSAIFLMIKTESTSSYEIKSAMLSYATDYTRKVIIDKLQTTLKCCGSQEAEDWFSVNWQNTQPPRGRHCRNVTRCVTWETDWDSVPFSCCCLESPPPCIHNRLRSYGTESLYSTGCAEKLDDAVFVFVLLAVIMFFISTFLMAVILYSGRKLQTSARSAICKGDATAPGCWWLLTPPGHTVRSKSMTDCLPLLVRTSDDSLSPFKCENNHAGIKNKLKKIVTSPALFVKNLNPYKSCDEESSDEWAGRLCEPSHSTSNSSFTMTEANNTILASHQSVSDTAVAHVDTSHQYGYKARPLFRS